ncbi:MAG: hypothetical protein KDK36_09470, partial [Leptospiraceae bacterium]|nr:hypothetical protein [Leptospiraceae bacterium]
MKAESLGNNEYRLLDNTGNNIGSINLDGFLKREAKANFNGKFILFKPKGFLSQTMQVFENDNEIASIHMDFFSKIKIQFT